MACSPTIFSQKYAAYQAKIPAKSFQGILDSLGTDFRTLFVNAHTGDGCANCMAGKDMALAFTCGVTPQLIPTTCSCTSDTIASKVCIKVQTQCPPVS